MEETKKIDWSKMLRGDKIIWIVFACFCLLSVLELFSAESYLAFIHHSIYYPVIRHSLSLLTGCALMIMVSYIPITKLRKGWLIWGSYALTIVMQLMTFSSHFAVRINGANRSIHLLGQTIQPSEFLKITLMLVVARLMWRYSELKERDEEQAHYYYWGALLAILVPAGLVAPSNLSTCIMMIVSGLFVMFLGGLKWKHAIYLCLAFTLGFGGLYYLHTLGVRYPEKMHLNSAMKRIDTMTEHWGQPEDESKYLIERNSDLQEKLCKVAIADGRTPKGPGNSLVRDDLPVAHADSIFAICVEDLGLFGAAFLIMLYFIILYRGGHIAVNSPDLFSALVVAGLSLMVTMQAIISMLVVCGFGPNTGQPLPFISWGWWDIWAMCLVLGLMQSASCNMHKGDDLSPSLPEKTRRHHSTRHRKRESDMDEKNMQIVEIE